MWYYFAVTHEARPPALVSLSVMDFRPRDRQKSTTRLFLLARRKGTLAEAYPHRRLQMQFAMHTWWMRAKNDTWEISWSIVHCTSYPSTFCTRALRLLNLPLLSDERATLRCRKFHSRCENTACALSTAFCGCLLIRCARRLQIRGSDLTWWYSHSNKSQVTLWSRLWNFSWEGKFFLICKL